MYPRKILITISSRLTNFLRDLDFVLLSIDMDGFDASHAPGVSAPAHVGFSPQFVQILLPHLFDSGKVIGIDIAETNPSYDVDGRTSRLASAIIHQMVGLL